MTFPKDWFFWDIYILYTVFKYLHFSKIKLICFLKNRNKKFILFVI